MNNKGLLVVISGPSGVGKGTVLKNIFATDENVKVSVSATTRKPRPGEVDGTHYFFVNEKQFLQAVNDGGMLEYAQYSGNYYGTPRQMVERELALGHDVILEIEVQGAMQIKKAYPEVLTIFVMPPSMCELKKRLTERRTEDEAAISRRIDTAQKELQMAYDYDYIVINDKIDAAAQRLKAILCAEKCSAKYMKEFIDEVQK
ncbi:MAG: guanylate kinase [Hydrogenoanaerobacterium sp.]